MAGRSRMECRFLARGRTLRAERRLDPRIITRREREKPISTSSSGLRHRSEEASLMTGSAIGL
jgi:hypothetical protein